MTTWCIAVSLLAWCIGVIVLGYEWRGHESAPGVWVDGVSLKQWAACWMLLALLAAGSARVLQGWRARLLALLPLVAWILWHLRVSTLGPIPMVIYVVPTTLVWCGGLLIGSVVWQRLARSVYGS